MEQLMILDNYQTYDAVIPQTTMLSRVEDSQQASDAFLSHHDLDTRRAEAYSRNIIDSRWHEVTTQQLFQNGALWSAIERPANYPTSGLWLRLIEVRPDGSRKKRLIDYHFIRPNGIGVNCFHCPEDGCEKSFATRRGVQRHMTETSAHPNTTKHWRDHPTVAGYPYKAKTRPAIAANRPQHIQRDSTMEAPPYFNTSSNAADMYSATNDTSPDFDASKIIALRHIAAQGAELMGEQMHQASTPVSINTQCNDVLATPALDPDIIDLWPTLSLVIEPGSVTVQPDHTLIAEQLRPMPPNPSAFFYANNHLQVLETAGIWDPMSKRWTSWENFKEPAISLVAAGYNTAGLHSLALGLPLPVITAWPPVQRELEAQRSAGQFRGDTTVLPMPLYIGTHGGIPVYTFSSYGGPPFDSIYFGRTPFRLYRDDRPWPRRNGDIENFTSLMG